ncbi:Ninjurin [Popillia japonica]|uniref:Ninjurin n=1 Tax=Popillia japonica TaxID=7064 RepID=A0AAW1IFT2_POPJA
MESREERLDINAYTTTQTISQGLLDTALLSTNALTLNFLLAVGPMHRFYTFLIVAVSTSIFLTLNFLLAVGPMHRFYTFLIVAVSTSIFIQLFQILLCAFLSNTDIHKRQNQEYAVFANNFILYTNALLILINAFITAFEMKAEYTFHRYWTIENMSERYWSETSELYQSTTYLPS